jgi:hypothetical protein
MTAKQKKILNARSLYAVESRPLPHCLLCQTMSANSTLHTANDIKAATKMPR